MSEETPRIVVTVAAPVEAVWDSLRNKEKIQHWHGWEYEELDAEIDQIFFTAFTEDGEAHTLDCRAAISSKSSLVTAGRRSL